MKECPPDQAKIAREILDHIAAQAGGEDTLEGILLHRLPEKAASRETTLVKEVVADLVTQGLLEKVKKDERTVYQIRSRL